MARDTEQPPGSASAEPKRRKKSSPPRRESDAALNAIERSRAPQRAELKAGKPRTQPDAAARHQSAPAGAADKNGRSRAVPDEIRERFIGIGANYYFPDGAAAFTDHG